MKKIKKFLFVNSNVKQTIVKNTFWLFVSEAAARLLRMIFIIFAARVLGAGDWGIFSYALSVGSLFMVLSDIGINNIITREIAQNKDKPSNFISTMLFLKSIILLISTILVIIISPHISHIKEANILFPIIALIFFFDALRELAFAINRAYEKMEKEMIVKTAMNTIVLLAGVLLLKSNLSPISIAIAYVLGSGIGLVTVLIMIWDDIRKTFSKIDKSMFFPSLKIAFPFAIIALLSTILGNADIYMLGIWKSSVEIGLYTSAQRIQNLIMIIPAVISIATLPLMSQLAKNDNDKFGVVLEKIISLVIATAVPIALLGTVLSKQIIYFVLGSGYSEAGTIFSILMFMLIVSFPFLILNNISFAQNNQKHLALSYFFALIINLIMNIILIPKFGATGSVISSLFSTSIATFYLWEKTKEKSSLKIKLRLNKIFLSAVITIILTLIMKIIGIHVIINVLISIILYLFLLRLLKESLLENVKYSLKHEKI